MLLQAEEETPILLLDSVKYPYLAVEYNSGTTCDLTHTPRRTTVQYICHERGRGDLYELKETSTCEYTVIILSSKLCKNPKYRYLFFDKTFLCVFVRYVPCNKKSVSQKSIVRYAPII